MRSFVALTLPDPAREAAGELIGRLAPSGAPVKWVNQDLLHVTLKFLGEVPEDLAPDLQAALAQALAGQAALRLRLFGCGAFPSLKRPQVVWLGLWGQTRGLAVLASLVERALAPLGFPPEERAFKAHLTIGRVKSGRGRPKGRDGDRLVDLARNLAGLADWQGPEFSADTVALVKSTLRPTGPIYRHIEVFKLVCP